jgi:hypothetical protein
MRIRSKEVRWGYTEWGWNIYDCDDITLVSCVYGFFNEWLGTGMELEWTFILEDECIIDNVYEQLCFFRWSRSQPWSDLMSWSIPNAILFGNCPNFLPSLRMGSFPAHSMYNKDSLLI